LEYLLTEQSPLARPVADFYFQALSTKVFFKSVSKIITAVAPKQILYTTNVLFPSGVRPVVDFQSEALLAAYHFSRMPTGFFFRTRKGEMIGKGLHQAPYNVMAVLDYAARSNLMLLVYLFDFYGLLVTNEWPSKIGNMCTDVIREKAWRDAAPKTVYPDVAFYRGDKSSQFADVRSISQSLQTLFDCLLLQGYPVDIIKKIDDISNWEFLRLKKFFLPSKIKGPGMKVYTIQTEDAGVVIPLVPGAESDYDLYPKKWFIKTKDIIRIAPTTLNLDRSKQIRVVYDSNRAVVARFSISGDCSFLVYDGKRPYVEVQFEYPLVKVVLPTVISPYE